MSYCRWSSDNFGCDLYCYEDVLGGYTTHVAGLRPVGEVPKVTCDIADKPEEWLKAHNAQMEFLSKCHRAKIGLPYDGQSFNDPTLEDFLKRLVQLKDEGYRFPEYVIEDVKEEIADLSAARSNERTGNEP